MNHYKHLKLSQAVVVLFTAWLVSIFGTCQAKAAEDYGTKEAVRIAETMLLHQHENGGWEKNYDREEVLDDAARKKLENNRKNIRSTIDNSATHSEVRYLAQVFQATGEKRYSNAAMAGIRFMLDAQYDNGGWPQFYPTGSGYYRHITYNDGAMIGVMKILRDIGQNKSEFAFVDNKTKSQAAKALEKGIDCILRTQITVRGKKTAWCAQHDEKTLAPAKARSYELPSISGSESVGIVRFLMDIDKPSPEIREAIEGAVAWFNEAKLTGVRVEIKRDPSLENGRDRIVVKDPNAPALWARFYEIGTNKPIYCSRDGIPRPNLADISYERRNGYSWVGDYAGNLLNRDYPAWLKKQKQGR